MGSVKLSARQVKQTSSADAYVMMYNNQWHRTTELKWSIQDMRHSCRGLVPKVKYSNSQVRRNWRRNLEQVKVERYSTNPPNGWDEKAAEEAAWDEAALDWQQQRV